MSDDGLTVERPGDPGRVDEVRVEFAAGRTGGSGSAFPVEWGPAPGRDGQDPTRRAWIRAHVGDAVDQRIRELGKRDARLAVALERALLERRR